MFTAGLHICSGVERGRSEGAKPPCNAKLLFCGKTTDLLKTTWFFILVLRFERTDFKAEYSDYFCCSDLE